MTDPASNAVVRLSGAVARGATSAGLKLSTDDVRDVAGEIEWAKASLISPNSPAM